MSDALSLAHAVLPVIAYAAGVLTGAGLLHRARTGQSPLPKLPALLRRPPAEPTAQPEQPAGPRRSLP